MKIYKKNSKGYKLVGEGEIIQKTEHNVIIQLPNYKLSVGYIDLQQKEYLLKENDGNIYKVTPLPTEKQIMSAIRDKTKAIVPEELKTEDELSRKRSETARKGWETRKGQKLSNGKTRSEMSKEIWQKRREAKEIKTISAVDAEMIKAKIKALAQQAVKLVLEAEKLKEALSQDIINGG